MRANAKLFSEAFTQAAKVINSRTPKEVFKYVHAVANGGRLTLTGANGELILQRSIPCEGDLPAVLLPVQVGEVAKLSSDWIDVTTAGESLIVATPTGKSKLQTRAAEEFPLPEPVEGEPIQIPEGVWHAVGRFVAPCAGICGNYATTGVCINKAEGMAEFVATTDSRAGISSCQTDANWTKQVVKPEVFGLIAGDVTARISPSMASFASGDVTAWSRLVSGRFPEYGGVFESAMEGADRSVTVESSILMNAVKAVGVTVGEMADEGVDFTIGNGEIKVETAASDKGESHATVPAATNGDACTFRLSHAFMVEFLRKAPTGENIQIDYGDSSGVMLSSGRARCLIMTMDRG